MLISLSENRIVIQPEGDLAAHISSQFKYYGFRWSDSRHNKLERDIDDSDDIVIRLVRYLSQEEIEFVVDASVEKILSDARTQNDNLGHLKSLARSFQEGEHTDGFNEFQRFVETNVHRKLKPHQLKAAFHLFLIRNGANFSVPGSGKTSVVLSVYEKLRQDGIVNMIFVVGPPACFAPWKNEFRETLNRDPISKLLVGGNRESRELEYFRKPLEREELYLTTFQTIANDRHLVESFFRQKGVSAFLVIDEAHYMKQIGGIWAQAILAVAGSATVRCALTGTPIPNRYSDLFNVFDFLWGKNTILRFDTKFQIQRLEESGEFEDAKQVLTETIGPLFYRVRKDDLGLTQQVFHDPNLIKMNKIEKKLYDAIVTKIRSYSKEDYLRNIDVVRRLRKGRIMRLRQCTSYAKLLSTALDDYEEDVVESDLAKLVGQYDTLEIPAKLEFLTGLVQGLRSKGEKVIIWCHFVKSLESISNHLLSSGFNNKCIYGKTPTENTDFALEETRESIRDEFVDPSSGLDVLLANPAACAESISLHKTCHNAVYYDLSYNAAQYLQSLDRIHRVGGSETTISHYHFLQYENTIDQDIRANLETKALRMSQIVDQEFPVYSLDMFEQGDEDVTAYERLFGPGQDGTH